jgi:hypothetical protein
VCPIPYFCKINSVPNDCSPEKHLAFEDYLTNYAREAIEMSESPLHMLNDIMAMEKNGSLRSSKGM